MTYETAGSLWAKMDAERADLMLRSEALAALTLPHLCLPLGRPHESTPITYGYTSLGAECTNHLVNKLMLTLFRPGIPFFRLRPDAKGKEALAKEGYAPENMAAALSPTELEAMRQLDTSGQRPKLNNAIEHLVVLGNALLVIEPDHFRVMGLRHWAVKRNYRGDWIRLIIREQMCCDELDESVTAAMIAAGHFRAPEQKVYLYKVLTASKNYVDMTQWVDDYQLPDQFNGRWKKAKCPYRVCTWTLPDESDYGIGLVQFYWGDLQQIEDLSQSTSEGAQVATELRWGVDPVSSSTANDLNSSQNGDFVPARKDDITPIFGGNHEALRVADAVLERYERRVNAGFLRVGAAVRNAERVTAEEVRLQALELETAYGGTYSALARDLQAPVAYWALERSNTRPEDYDLETEVLTGLDALTRNAELESLRAALGDLAMAAQLPEQLQRRLKWEPLAAFVGAGRGSNLKPFLYSDEEMQAINEQEQQQRVNEEAAIQGGKVAANQLSRGQAQ